MQRILAAVQLLFICLIVGYSTYELFRGNFMVAFAALPLLMGYYVFLASMRRKRELREEEPADEE